jgi:hypothetical protein
MRPSSVVGLATSFSIWLASVGASAQAGPQYPAPYAQPGAPYPYYVAPPPPMMPPPAYGPQYTQPSYAPPRIKYQEGMAPPRGYHLEENPRRGLVVAGSVVLGTTYFLSAMIGISSGNKDDRWLMLPLFGPFFDIAARNEHGCSGGSTASNAACEVFDPIIKFYLAMDGVAQTAGGILLATGFIFPKKEFVSDTYYGARPNPPLVATWTVVPQVIPGSRYGLMLRGALF